VVGEGNRAGLVGAGSRLHRGLSFKSLGSILLERAPSTFLLLLRPLLLLLLWMAVIEEGLVPSCSRGHPKRLSKLACIGRKLCASEQNTAKIANLSKLWGVSRARMDHYTLAFRIPNSAFLLYYTRA
jgi:hypothetical protein